MRGIMRGIMREQNEGNIMREYTDNCGNIMRHHTDLNTELFILCFS